MTRQLNVLILGYGEMGHAMEHLLVDHHNLSIWDKFPVPGFAPVKLEHAVPHADFVLFCLPVNPHREIVTLIEPLLNNKSICLSIAKGLDEEGLTAAQIFDDVLGGRHHHALLYGPMISEEIRAGRYAFAQLGVNSDGAGELTQQLFNDSHLYVDCTHDIAGISWSVILKNVYAIIFGVADELRMGDNTRGYLMVEVMRELDNIVLDMGGDAGSVYNLAGLGDLITTATSEGSHHHSLGRKLARGNASDIAGEGVHTLAMVRKFDLFAGKNYPMFNLVDDIIGNPADTTEILQRYIENRFSSGT